MIYSYNALAAKAYILFDIGDILLSYFISYFHVSLKELLFEFEIHFSWEALIQCGHHVTLKKQN